MGECCNKSPPLFLHRPPSHHHFTSNCQHHHEHPPHNHHEHHLHHLHNYWKTSLTCGAQGHYCFFLNIILLQMIIIVQCHHFTSNCHHQHGPPWHHFSIYSWSSKRQTCYKEDIFRHFVLKTIWTIGLGGLLQRAQSHRAKHSFRKSFGLTWLTMVENNNFCKKWFKWETWGQQRSIIFVQMIVWIGQPVANRTVQEFVFVF